MIYWRKKSNKNSDKIMDNILSRKINVLFDKLDSDHDGIISPVRIDVNNINPKKLKILAPLFIEMEEMNIALDIDEFKEAVKKLIRVISIVERNELLEINQGAKICTGGTDDYSYEPKINPLSRILAKKRSPFSRHSKEVSSFFWFLFSRR